MGHLEDYAWIVEAVEQLPGTRVEDRVAWDCLILWVADKWFGMIIPNRDGEVVLTLKGDPELNHALVGAHSWIVPGYHMNKRHWISLRLSHPDASRGLALDLLDDAWDVTVDTLPKRVREPLPPQMGAFSTHTSCESTQACRAGVFLRGLRLARRAAAGDVAAHTPPKRVRDPLRRNGYDFSPYSVVNRTHCDGGRFRERHRRLPGGSE